MADEEGPTNRRRVAGGAVSGVAICGAFISFALVAEQLGASRHFLNQMIGMSGFIGPGAFIIGYRFPGPFTDWIVRLWGRVKK